MLDHSIAELDRRKSGISDSGISLNHGKVKTIPIPLIEGVEQQRQLVDSLKGKLDYISRVEDEIEINLGRSETLRQSILKKAFSGQLVPQDPNDEPASALLARIQAGKNSSLAKLKTKGKRTTKANSKGPV